MRRVCYIVVLILSLIASPCMAEYVATGAYKGEVCTGFIVKTCSLEKLDAVEKDGTFYNINMVWKSVDSYKNGMCWIRFGKGTLGLFDSPPNFYQYDENGTLRPVDVDSYIVFPCKKQ